MNQPLRFMSKKAFADRRGVGKSAVSNWVKKGWVVEAEDPADGAIKVDVPRTEAKLNAYLDPARGRPKAGDSQGQCDLPLAAAPKPAEPKGDSVAEVRVDLMRQQITGQALKNAQAAGELVLLADYARRASELGRLSRERIQALVRTHAEWLGAAKEPRAIVAFMAEEIDRVFADLAEQVMSAEADGDDADTPDEAAEVEAALAEGDGEGEDQLEAG